jgi:hypothetical protein
MELVQEPVLMQESGKPVPVLVWLPFVTSAHVPSGDLQL